MILRPILVLATLLALSGCTKEPQPPPPSQTETQQVDPVHGHLLHAQPTLPTVRVWLGDQEVITEIARRDVEVATGMMFRTNMPENTAMIFVFDFPRQQSFYMRNCIVPLSAAYISPTGEILQLIDMQPHNENGIPSESSNVQYVLEVPQGWFRRHHIDVGTVVRTERGSLRESFQNGR